MTITACCMLHDTSQIQLSVTVSIIVSEW